MTERTSDNGADYYRPLEAARLLHVTMKTLTRWATSGTIRATVLPSGHRRYVRADIDAIVAGKRGDAA